MTEERTARRWAIVITVLLGCVGVVWDVLAAAVLLHSYGFFESVVVCLLVMILCAVATMRADFELWSGIFRGPKAENDKAVEPDLLDQVRAHMKVLFYGIAFLMAFVKLVLTLIG
jgi:hypothetical protein